MVNTFLVHTDFSQSAKLLDRKRLPNQRREAFQILCHIQRLTAMGHALDNPVPINPYSWYTWIRHIIKQYRQHCDQYQCQLVRIDDCWDWYPVDDTLEIGPRDLTIKLGFIYHPAVLMWLGYEDALKQYLNAHIDEAITRGINNKMEHYSVTNVIRPSWTYDSDFIARHRAILLQKELEREEPPWYQINDLFTDSTVTCRYYWPYTPTIGQSATIHGEADVSRKYAHKIKITVKCVSKN